MHPAVSHSLLSAKPDPWPRFVVLSIAVHVALVFAGLAYAHFNRAPPLELDQKPIKASLVRLGKKRDDKLLPRKETPPPPPKKVDGVEKVEAVAPSEPVKPAVAVPLPNVKPTPETTRKQSGENEGQERKSALFGAFDKVAKQAEELEGDPDGDPDGDSAIQEGERYYGLINAQVRRRYDLPDTISEQERMYLKAQVHLRIGRSGSVVEARLSKPSGNEHFDAAVLSAVRKASPFSPPPDTLRASIERTGVVLEFSP